MSVLDDISALVKEPTPAYAFELSEGGIASSYNGQIAFKPLPENTVSASPLRDNVQNVDVFDAAVRGLYPANGKNRRRAALILPDYSARVQVLDFDSFPTKPEEQLQLIRFRVKKTTPFDIDTAVISYHVQRADHGKIDVITAIVALEVLARYEATFRNAGYHTGFVTTSTLAALPLAPDDGVSIFAKLSARTLTVIALNGVRVKLIRTLALEHVTDEEILAVLHPTAAYVEDELQTSPGRLTLCGFGEYAAAWGPLWEAEFGIPVEPARSRFGTPGPFDAGLLGYLQEGGAAQ